MSMIRQRTSGAGDATELPPQQHSTSQQIDSQQIACFLLANLHVDLASLNDVEIAMFLAQAVESLDALQHQHQQQGSNLSGPEKHQQNMQRNKIATTLTRILSTMPWGRLFFPATLPANVAVESKNNSTGKDKDKDNNNNNNKDAAAAATAAISNKKLNRMFPSSSKDVTATKATRRRICMFFSLLCVRLGEMLPSLISELLAAALKFFSQLPPAAQVSVKMWKELPAQIATPGDTAAAEAAPGAHQHKHYNVKQVREFAGVISAHLDSEVDGHLFRAIAVLLARQQEAQFQQQSAKVQGSAAAAAASASPAVGGRPPPQHGQPQQQLQKSSSKTAAASAPPVFSVAASAQLLLRNPCYTVLERHIPKKRWPVVAHHISWYNIMGKFFHRSFVEAAARSLDQPGNNSNSDIALRAHATLTQLWRGPVLRMMLSGLCNLEVASRQDRELSTAARRCSATVVDALLNSTVHSDLDARQHKQLADRGQQNEGGSAALFKLVLSHYMGTVAYLAPPVSAVHAVALCAAIVLDRAALESSSGDKNSSSSSSSSASCVATLVSECCSRLGQMLESKVQADVFALANQQNQDRQHERGEDSSATKSLVNLPRDSAGSDVTGIEQLLCFSHLACSLRCLQTMMSQSQEVNRVVTTALQQQQQRWRSVFMQLLAVCKSKASRGTTSASWLLSESLEPLAKALNIDAPSPQQQSPVHGATPVGNSNKGGNKKQQKKQGKKQQQQQQQPQKEEDDDVGDVVFSITAKAPEVTNRVVRCYASFSIELLPFQ